MRTIDVRQSHRLEAVRTQEIRRRFRARLHVAPAVGVGADARDAHEGLELGAGEISRRVDCGDGIGERAWFGHERESYVGSPAPPNCDCNRRMPLSHRS